MPEENLLLVKQINLALTTQMTFEAHTIREGSRKPAITESEVREWADIFFAVFKDLYPLVTLERKPTVDRIADSCYTWLKQAFPRFTA